MTVDHDVIVARVRMFLDGGLSYNEALRRAYAEQRPYPIQSVAAMRSRFSAPVADYSRPEPAGGRISDAAWSS